MMHPPTLRVLIAEDEALVALALEDELSSAGYEVDMAATGEEVVQFALSRRPSLVIMDVNLAGKTSGIDAAYTIRAHSDVPIVFVSGYHDSRIKRRAAKVRPAAFCVKPISIAELRGIVESIVPAT